jgi:two-component system NtrC family sensor kinase
MTWFKRIKPVFWDYLDMTPGPFRHMFNFRRIWKLTVLIMTVVALLPVLSLAIIDYNVTRSAAESEILLRTSRLVSNARRTVSFFLVERKSAIHFLAQDNTYEKLNDPLRLSRILENLKIVFGGFADIGVLDASGQQRNYVGPYHLEGRNYSAQPWFKEALAQGVYVSDVFLGYRKSPHLVVAVKKGLANGDFFVLRATLDTAQFNDLLFQLDTSGLGDAFIINREGVIQTPTRSHGKVFEKLLLPVPEFSDRTQVFETRKANGKPLVVGYAYIPETPYILMIVRQKNDLMQPWLNTRMQLIEFLGLSVVLILVAVFWVATYLVNNIHLADQKRIASLHEAEYANKMASIGRLAAGVAHEINNPLAIINEKAGLIKDIFTFKKTYAEDKKLNGLVDSIIASVERCGTITKRMLNFSRHMDSSIEPVDIKTVIFDVLGFLGKEAQYRCIDVTVDAPEDIPKIESDRGKLQQIFLNIVNNAFAALSDGGKLEISVQKTDTHQVAVTFADNGCGIPEADLNRVFEPFFSTKTHKGGTGLGLSITYNLAHELGGNIQVKSKVNEGTRFTITLPLKD